MRVAVIGAGLLGLTTAWFLRKSGADVIVFDRELDVNMDYFVSLGVFICLEKLRLMTLRNFVKRVAIAVD